uniref:Molybdenum cofactor biosynthesis protein B n=1 Tax=Candidatus Kentrum sp. TC TaxID=2126339 RepID=A0A450YQ30_9GAMM|nr:MAG: molybdenum cofactor biosynthesis protein B [Candidatus Kentron sp. TC]VFK45120.1 MAG: molybdenum cofactor biosynthesis protein B [Candidatus Kentron sp. TC]VFK58301.1 MAG: molybdenum cofactor biosynthesis protein B [Candidatus Kentron sp. TC]
MTHDAHGPKDRYFIPLSIAVLTISDSRTEETDGSGKVLVERLTDKGHSLAEKRIVPDDMYGVRAVVSHWIADPNIQVIISTGGTGLTARDGTPEAVKPLLDKEIEGFGEMFRAVSLDEIGSSALQSRALAGVANGTYLFCLPGSSGACRTGWDRLIEAQLDYRTRPCNFVELMPQLSGAGEGHKEA